MRDITYEVWWFKTFVANRVQQIEANITSGQWCYIPPRKILQIVPQGDWMLLKWIQLIAGFKARFQAKWRCHCRASKWYPELKKDITSYSALLSEDVITIAENRISRWLKLKRVTALVLLYKQKLLESGHTRNHHQKYIEVAERNWLVSEKYK